MTAVPTPDFTALAAAIKTWGLEAGFQQVGIADIQLGADATYLQEWLEKGHHGELDYMHRHGEKRWRPDQLVPGTLRSISARMDYWPEAAQDAQTVLDDPSLAYVSRYAVGRDYHKLLRARLAGLADRISGQATAHGYRVFVDSGPVLEKALARNAGLGWIGKHTNLINRNAGSWFFLGEILTDLPLPIDAPVSAHCGSCTACIDICPTQAIIGPNQLDARRCISYLTIELRGSIPTEFRKALGNRIYGCDDCQLVCPWNKYARVTVEPDFAPRHRLDGSTLIELFAWSEEEFLKRTEGSAIRRIGYECWLRNIAVALGNAPASQAVLEALQARSNHTSELVREHVEWALAQHRPAPIAA
ncbi:MAG: tRNA epoxyqueuosine(34) reductase QueG [Candidatus Obscuribacterales bacterium]|nr:tRNA epoxyqueuosine(34) reductase QueG [Steroidobacteraceae bacterium]